MGKKTASKLAVKKETMRKLAGLTDDQLRAAAGGTLALSQATIQVTQIQQQTLICAGIISGGVRTLGPTCRCDTDGCP
jgi:hypothetical protein